MLLKKLIGKQIELDLSDKAFAEKLGVPRSTWQLTRTKLRPLGRRVALAAMKAFPDLTPEIASFLLSGASGVPGCETDVA